MARLPTSTTARSGKLPSALPPFPVSDASPFPDKYDIAGERLALQDIVEAADVDTTDARYSRYVVLEQREALLQQMQNEYTRRDGAEVQVPFKEAFQVQSAMGPLAGEEEDIVDLHTREGARLFMGRAIRPGESGFPMPGAKRIGAALKAVWYLSGNDNPFADCCLIEAHTSVTKLVGELNDDIDGMESRMKQLRKRGIRYSVLGAKPPVPVTLGFRSPYGYALVNLVASFDYYTRVTKTLERKDLLGDEEAYAQIHTRFRKARALFERVLWWQRYLMREELLTLSRSDWLPGADELATKRVQAATGIFGELVRDVFTGKLAPRHTKRRVALKPEELRLLNEVPLTVADAALEAAADTLELQ